MFLRENSRKQLDLVAIKHWWPLGGTTSGKKTVEIFFPVGYKANS
jgi:hypothetical protein